MRNESAVDLSATRGRFARAARLTDEFFQAHVLTDASDDEWTALFTEVR